MEGGQALVAAQGKRDGDTWTVDFTRKLAGGEGDVLLEQGKIYNFGMAIHDDHGAGRYHHVSLGYHLGIGTAAEITAAPQQVPIQARRRSGEPRVGKEGDSQCQSRWVRENQKKKKT